MAGGPHIRLFFFFFLLPTIVIHVYIWPLDSFCPRAATMVGVGKYERLYITCVGTELFCEEGEKKKKKHRWRNYCD